MRFLGVTAAVLSYLATVSAQSSLPPSGSSVGPDPIPKAPVGGPVSVPKTPSNGAPQVPKGGTSGPAQLPKGGANGPPQLPKGTSGGSPQTSKGAASSGKAVCSAVHFIIGRGSGEPQGTGMLRILADQIAKEIPGVTTEGIVYPAALNFSNLLNYVSSSGEGAKAGKNQITQYVKSCPQAKVVITGVSQGADVAGSSVCGGGSLMGFTPAIAPVSSEVGSHIVAIALFGDPRFRKGMSFNRGTSKNTGIIPHTTAQNCRSFASRLLSFCDTGDPFCDSGQDMGAHARVVTKHMEEARTFIISKIKSLTIPVRPDS